MIYWWRMSMCCCETLKVWNYHIDSFVNTAVSPVQYLQCVSNGRYCSLALSHPYIYVYKYFWTVILPCNPWGHDDVIKWKHFPRNWPYVWGIHWSPVNSLHKGQWRGVLVFSLICTWMNDWVNSREAGDLRCHRAHYGVTVMTRSVLKRL